LRIVNGSDSNHLNNREYRSERITLANLTSANGRYEWTVPWPISTLVTSGDVVKLQIRASNANNTLSTQSQGIFMVPAGGV